MTETETADPVQSGIAVLRTNPEDRDRTAGGTLDREGPWVVHGVAIPDEAETRGRSGQTRFWPSSTLERAAPLLVERPIVKNFHELEGQAPADDVIGQVTDAEFTENVGIAFKGEITDKEIAEKIAAGFLEVSPVPLITDEIVEDEEDRRVVRNIGGFRDIAVVAEGAGKGNEINIGNNPSIGALSAEALQQAFEEPDEAPDGGSDGEEPAADADTGGGDKTSATGDDGPHDQATDGEGQSTADAAHEDSAEQGDDQQTLETMSDENELTEAEEKLLAVAEDPEEALEAVQEWQSAEEPEIVEQTHLEALEAAEEDREELSDVLRDALMETEGYSETIVEDLSYEALTAEFRNDEGDIEAEALTQQPETKEPTETDTSESNEEEQELLSELGFDDRDEAVEALREKHENFESRGWEGRPLERVESQLETLGAEV